MEKVRLLSQPRNASPNPGLKTVWGAMKFLATPSAGDTLFVLAVFLLRSSDRGSVRLGSTVEAGPTVVAPPLPKDARKRLRHGLDQLAAWERCAAFRALKLEPLFPHDLEAPDAVAAALERGTISYGHMVGTCPMGPVLDADCRVHGIPTLPVADQAERGVQSRVVAPLRHHYPHRSWRSRSARTAVSRTWGEKGFSRISTSSPDGMSANEPSCA